MDGKQNLLDRFKISSDIDETVVPFEAITLRGRLYKHSLPLSLLDTDVSTSYDESSVLILFFYLIFCSLFTNIHFFGKLFVQKDSVLKFLEILQKTLDPTTFKQTFLTFSEVFSAASQKTQEEMANIFCSLNGFAYLLPYLQQKNSNQETTAVLNLIGNLGMIFCFFFTFYYLYLFLLKLSITLLFNFCP